MIVNDINEIWSLDLAYVDKIAKYNRGVQYLLIAVDCLSRYLRVEPQKTTEASMLKKQPKLSKNDQNKTTKIKFGLTKAPSSKESSTSYVLNEKSSNTILTVNKNQRLPKETFDR